MDGCHVILPVGILCITKNVWGQSYHSNLDMIQGKHICDISDYINLRAVFIPCSRTTRNTRLAAFLCQIKSSLASICGRPMVLIEPWGETGMLHKTAFEARLIIKNNSSIWQAVLKELWSVLLSFFLQNFWIKPTKAIDTEFLWTSACCAAAGRVETLCGDEVIIQKFSTHQATGFHYHIFRQAADMPTEFF